MEWSHLDNHNHSSRPIEIPQRRRRLSTFSPLPTEQSQSPDLIFEMSPITSNFSSHSNFLPHPSPRNNYDQEPFLYHLPVFSARNFKKSNCMHDAPVQCHDVPISHTFTPIQNAHKRQRRVAEQKTNGNAGRFSGGAPIIRKSATTKIVGFSPATPTTCAHCSTKKSLQPQERLSPGLKSPFSWSQYALPGKEGQGEETSSIKIEGSPLGFDNYLLRRTQDPERFRLNSLQLIPSARF